MKQATNIASTAIVNTTFSLPAALLIPIIMKSSRLRLPTARIIFRPTLIASAFNIVTMYSLVTAYRLAPVSQVNTTFQGVSALSVLVGIIALRERKYIPLKLVGAALTTIGIMLLV